MKQVPTSERDSTGPSLRDSYKAMTRQNILRQAVKLFQKNGFSSTSIEDIAKAANVSRSTIYLHFRNKSEIIHGVVGDGLKKQYAIYQKLVESQVPIDLEFTRNWVQEYSAHLRRINDTMGKFAVIFHENAEIYTQIVENRRAEVALLGTRFSSFSVCESDPYQNARKMQRCLFMLYRLEQFPRYTHPDDAMMYEAGLDELARSLFEMLELAQPAPDASDEKR